MQTEDDKPAPESRLETIVRMESLLADVNADAQVLADRMRDICRMAQAIRPAATLCAQMVYQLAISADPPPAI